jgi:hypothetical protein
MLDILFNLIGLTGMASFLFAYLMLQRGRWTHDSYIYLMVNLAGAILILISLWHDWNLSAFLLECAWAAISSWGLWKLYRKRKAAP